MPRKPPRSTEERLVRAQKSMMPGTLGGRVASAAPMALDVTRLDPRLRANPSSAVVSSGSDPASMSRISVSNFAPDPMTGGWQQLVFNAPEEVVGTDLTLDPLTGTVTVNTDGIYSLGAQLQMSSAPAGSWVSLDVGVSGPLLDAYMRNGQILSDPWTSRAVSVHFLPYFVASGNTMRVFAAAGYSSGGPYAPDFVTLWVQRLA